MKYRGTRNPVRVVVDDGISARPLPHVVWHSPDGFEWGYPGSGPADLALSILAHAAGERQSAAQAKQFDPSACTRAVHFHQEFKREFIATLPRDSGWQMEAETVRAWLAAREADALEVEQEGVA